MSYGKKFNIGLEAGSKTELHAVLATNIAENALIICNGYKDESYIELALLAQKMGRRIYLVVEKLNELRMIADTARRLVQRPNVGIRIKLVEHRLGKMERERRRPEQIRPQLVGTARSLDILERRDMKDCLKLIHFHIGSQINKIRVIKNAAARSNTVLCAAVETRLRHRLHRHRRRPRVDYDGTRSSSSESSMNYSIQEYANDAVSAHSGRMRQNDLKQPNIITESGRSLTAHHSVLIFGSTRNHTAARVERQPGD